MQISVSLCIFECLCMVNACQASTRGSICYVARFVLLVKRHVKTPIYDQDSRVLILHELDVSCTVLTMYLLYTIKITTTNNTKLLFIDYVLFVHETTCEHIASYMYT